MNNQLVDDEVVATDINSGGIGTGDGGSAPTHPVVPVPVSVHDQTETPKEDI